MHYLDACLTAVFSQDSPSFEVIVVDNGSTDGSADFVAARYPQAKLIRNKHNLGFAAGNNIGMRAAVGEMLILLNQDTVVSPGWLQALVAGTTRKPGPCIIGCKILYPDGTIQHAGGYLERPSALARHYGYREHDNGQWDAPRDVEFVTGAAIAITRSALNIVGELDEGLSIAYYEDIDWCFRARAAGLSVQYEPAAMLIHLESSSFVAGSYEQHLSFHRARTGFVLKHWPAAQLYDFVVAESAQCDTTLSTDDAIARARAYLVNVSRMHVLQRKRERLYGNQDIMQVDGNGWDFVAKNLLLARVKALNRASLNSMPFATMPLAPLPSEADVRALERSSALQEMQFKSSIPVLGALLVAFRTAWYGMAARWAVHYVVEQQRRFNQQSMEMFRTMYQTIARMMQLNQALLDDDNELSDQIRRLAEVVERDSPKDRN